MNKFDEIISDENMEIVTTVMSTVEADEKQKINLIETIANVVYCHEDWFEKLTIDEKIKVITFSALTFNMLFDKEINPYAANRIKIGVHAFNNNIFSASMGGFNYVTN